MKSGLVIMHDVVEDSFARGCDAIERVGLGVKLLGLGFLPGDGGKESPFTG